MSTATLYCGDVLDVLGTLPAESVRCCVTSPPYWALRDYGIDGQLGLEATPEEHVANMVAVFREVRRVLTDDGTLWLNLGDSYAGSWGAQSREHAGKHAPNVSALSANQVKAAQIRKNGTGSLSRTPGLKPKDLCMIPARLALALQADGWWLRSDIIWAKPNPMPESVRDRPTSAHEHIFLLAKSAYYYYDADAIKTEAKWPDGPNAPDAIKSPYGQGFTRRADKQRGHGRRHAGFNDKWDAMSKGEQQGMGANARNVWTIATKPYPEAHFATFPPELPSRCIKAGSAPGDTVLDPFGGSGTTAAVATGLGRNAIHIDLNPEYIELARQRIGPMLCEDVA